MESRRQGRVRPTDQLVSALGYAGSLRGYRWSALGQRVLRRALRRLRRLPGGRWIAPVPRPDGRMSAAMAACPTVDAGWATAALSSLGATVETITVGPMGFDSFLDAADFPGWYYGGPRRGGSSFREKAIEHYVASQLLRPSPGDVYVDVGADNSPFAEVAERLFGCTAYRLDAAYRPGVHGCHLGCDVRHITLPDGSVDVMAAHCAFDHFQGDADRAFLREAARVLRPGGRLCIVPLYLAERHTNFVDPAAWLGLVTLDRGADVVEVPGWGYEFTRYYAPETFLELAGSQESAFSLCVYQVSGVGAIDPACYVRLAAVFERRTTDDVDGTG